MIENEKKQGWTALLKDGLHYFSQVISANIFSPLAEGAETVLRNIECRIIRIEQRMLRKLSSWIVLWLGGIFLLFALFSFLREYLGWNNTIAFFSLGIVIFVSGLLLKIREAEKS